MGKKVTKLIKPIKKFTEKWDPLGAGLLNPIADNLSDQWLGTDWSGAKAADEAFKRDQASLQQAANNLAANSGVDLGLSNVTDVQVGGTATENSTSRRRRGGGSGGVASSLGINV